MRSFLIFLAMLITTKSVLCTKHDLLRVVDCQQEVFRGVVMFKNQLDSSYNKSLPAVAGWCRIPLTEWYGDEAMDRQAFLKLDYPLRDGVLTPVRRLSPQPGYQKSWSDLKNLWTLFFLYLGITCDMASFNRPVVMVMNPTENGKDLVLFTEWLTSVCLVDLLIADHASMTARSVDKPDVLVVDIGKWVTTISVVKDYHIVQPATKARHIGVMFINKFIASRLNLGGVKTGHSLTIAEDIWKKNDFVSQNYAEDMAKEATAFSKEYYNDHYKLTCQLGKERFEGPERWFTSYGDQYPALHQLVADKLVDLGQVYKENIIITGLGSQLSGLGERLVKELALLGLNVEITIQGDDPFFIHRGVRELAQTEGLDQHWVTGEEFKMRGVEALKEKWDWFNFE